MNTHLEGTGQKPVENEKKSDKVSIIESAHITHRHMYSFPAYLNDRWYQTNQLHVCLPCPDIMFSGHMPYATRVSPDHCPL